MEISYNFSNVLILVGLPIVAVVGYGTTMFYMVINAITRRPVLHSLGVYALTIGAYAASYYFISFFTAPKMFNRPFMDFVDALYFSVVTMTNVGFGDVFPTHRLSRLMASSQILYATLWNITIFAILAARLVEIYAKNEHARGVELQIASAKILAERDASHAPDKG